MKMYYKSGYKYTLDKSFYIQTNICPKRQILTDYFRLDTDGYMVIFKKYSFDGPSGPTIDTKNFMIGSLVHDVGYQALREKLLPIEYRKQIDVELKRICIQSGMSKIRAYWVYQAVRLFGKKAALPESKKRILVA